MLSRRLYRQLLHLYPLEFRARFEPEMLALFAEREAAADRTLYGTLAFWRAILGDLLRSAQRERFPGLSWRISMGELGYDVRQAWRAVARTPLLSAFVIALMALSIGSTTRSRLPGRIAW